MDIDLGMAVFYCFNDLCDVVSPKYQSGFEHDCLFSFDRGRLSDFLSARWLLEQKKMVGEVS